MKLSKSELKSIVKECLVELLSEGLGGNQSFGSPFVPQRSSLPPQLSDNIRRKTAQESKVQRTSISNNAALSEAIKKESGGDKILESILADTASSTLPKFLQAGDGKVPLSPIGGGIAEQLVSQTNPEDLFGDDVASKWSNLAFMNSPIKK